MSLISRLVGEFHRRLSEPERRTAVRESEPWLFVAINAHEHRARNWSAGGASIEGCAEDLSVGQIVSGTLRWHKKEVGHPFSAEVMRIEAGGNIALRWLALSDDMLAQMEPPEG